MVEPKKILLRGISQLWGTGGELTPWIPYYSDSFGSLVYTYNNEPLDDKSLPSNEYFQYSSKEKYDSLNRQSPESVPPAKFIIHDLNQNVLTCEECEDSSTVLERCSKCEYNKLFTGLFCNHCKTKHQQNIWICKNCGRHNIGENTLSHWVELYVLKPPIADSGSLCFIATACYGNSDAPEVLVLRQFRDDVLLKTYVGERFVKFYYLTSPSFAILISKSDRLRRFVIKYFLKPIISKLQQKNSMNSSKL